MASTTTQLHPSHPAATLLDRFPAEIIIEVFKQAPDFTTLFDLLSTCRRFSSLFDGNARRIVQAVTQREAIPPPTRRIMVAVLRIRTSTNPFVRGGATTGGLLSAFLQKSLRDEGVKIRIRDHFVMQDLHALSTHWHSYIRERVAEFAHSKGQFVIASKNAYRDKVAT